MAGVLRDEGFNPWLAEEALMPGENLAKAAGDAIETADAIVVLVSPHLTRSTFAQSEWNYAISSVKHAGRVVPVLTPGTSVDSAPWILKHMQFIAATRDWQQASRDVALALRRLRSSA